METRPTPTGSLVRPDAPTAESWTFGAPGSRRRRMVVDGGYQFRVSGMAAAVTLLLLLLLNLSLFFSGPAPARRDAESAGPRPASLGGQDPREFGLMLAGSVVFLAGVFVVGIVESHRTAGAAFAIRRGIEAFQLGDLGARVRLRRGDHLQDLGIAFNTMVAEAAATALREAETLDLLAARVEASGSQDVAVELRRLADAKRRLRA